MSNILKIAGAGVSAAAEETDPNFNQTVLLLHGDGSDGAQNNTFLDSSTNNFTVTRNGNTTQGTFSPFSAPDGRWSNFFDGTGDYLNTASISGLSESGDFTHEAWCYFIGSGIGEFDILFQKNINGFLYVARQKTGGSANKIIVNSHNIGTVATGTTTIALNQWYHIAFVRSGSGTNNCKVYLNGNLELQFTNTTNYTGTAVAYLGGYFQTHQANWYFSNLRITDTAVYTNTFTPSTAPLTAISGTQLLTCQSNRFVDNSSNAFAITRNGDVKVTPFSPFAPTAAYDASVNGGSGYFDGTGDHLVTPSNAALTLSGDFTISAWVYRTVAGVNGGIFTTAPSTTDVGVALVVTSGNVLSLRFGPDSTVVLISDPNTFPLNQWVYVGATRSGNDITLYLNGVAVATGTTTKTPTTTTGYIGRFYTNADNFYLTGYIANLKVVKGTATALTSIPTAPSTNTSGTELLLNFTNAGIFDNTGKNNLETVGDAQIDTTTKQFGTGSIEFDGTGDDCVQTVPSEELRLGTSDFTVEFWVYLRSITSNTTMARLDSGSGFNGILIGHATNLGCYATTDGTAWNLFSNQPLTGVTVGAWHHISITRSGSTFRGFVDGSVVFTITSSSQVYQLSPVFRIGSANSGGAVGMNGLIDEFRFTKGVARYTTTFTPPTKAFPDL